MRISNLQFKKLGESATLLFVQRICTFLKDRDTDFTHISELELEKAVSNQVIKAVRYGFNTEEQVVTYVIAAWLLGESFDTEFPAACKVLNCTILNEADKSEWLVQWTAKLLTVLESGRR